MKNNIVARLRDLKNAMDECGFTGISAVTNAAADEIERLREALRIEQEELAACCIDRRETQRERDEARREVCAIYADTYGSVGIVAEQRGWDCFKENTNE